MAKTIPVKREKQNLNKAVLEAMIDLNLPISNLVKEGAEIGMNSLKSPKNPLEGPSKSELTAIMQQKIKQGIVEFFKDFKLDEDKIHMEGATSATISDGSGGTYVIFFNLFSYEPPSVQIESMKKINYGQTNNL